MDLGLHGKRAIVFAASKGLGHAAANALAAEGCRLAICSRDETRITDAAAAIRNAHGGDVFPFVCDVRKPHALEMFMNRAIDALGGVDILVTNNSGPAPGAFDAIDDGAWSEAVDLVLMSVVR